MQGLNGGGEIADGGEVLGEGLFLRGDGFPARDHQALAVEQPAAGPGLFRPQAFLHHGGRDGTGDTDARLAGAVKQDSLLRQLAAADTQRPQQPRQGHRAGALDVVVEQADPVAVVLQQAEGVAIAKVLQLDQGAGEGVLYRADEFLHQGIVGLAALAPALQAQVQGIVEKVLVIGAHVQGDRQALGGMDAGAGGVQGQFAHRDAHARGPQVAQSENALAVGNHDDARVAVRPVVQDFANPAALIQ